MTYIPAVVRNGAPDPQHGRTTLRCRICDEPITTYPYYCEPSPTGATYTHAGCADKAAHTEAEREYERLRAETELTAIKAALSARGLVYCDRCEKIGSAHISVHSCYDAKALREHQQKEAP